MAEFRKCFEVLDRDHRGVITIQDLESYMKRMNYKETFVSKWIALFDPDNKGFITYESYCETLGIKPRKRDNQSSDEHSLDKSSLNASPSQTPTISESLSNAEQSDVESIPIKPISINSVKQVAPVNEPFSGSSQDPRASSIESEKDIASKSPVEVSEFTTQETVPHVEKGIPVKTAQIAPSSDVEMQSNVPGQAAEAIKLKENIIDITMEELGEPNVSFQCTLPVGDLEMQSEGSRHSEIGVELISNESDDWKTQSHKKRRHKPKKSKHEHDLPISDESPEVITPEPDPNVAETLIVESNVSAHLTTANLPPDHNLKHTESGDPAEDSLHPAEVSLSSPDKQDKFELSNEKTVDKKGTGKVKSKKKRSDSSEHGLSDDLLTAGKYPLDEIHVSDDFGMSIDNQRDSSPTQITSARVNKTVNIENSVPHVEHQNSSDEGSRKKTKIAKRPSSKSPAPTQFVSEADKDILVDDQIRNPLLSDKVVLDMSEPKIDLVSETEQTVIVEPCTNATKKQNKYDKVEETRKELVEDYVVPKLAAQTSAHPPAAYSPPPSQQKSSEPMDIHSEEIMHEVVASKPKAKSGTSLEAKHPKQKKQSAKLSESTDQLSEDSKIGAKSDKPTKEVFSKSVKKVIDEKVIVDENRCSLAEAVQLKGKTKSEDSSKSAKKPKIKNCEQSDLKSTESHLGDKTDLKSKIKSQDIKTGDLQPDEDKRGKHVKIKSSGKAKQDISDINQVHKEAKIKPLQGITTSDEKRLKRKLMKSFKHYYRQCRNEISFKNRKSKPVSENEQLSSESKRKRKAIDGEQVESEVTTTKRKRVENAPKRIGRFPRAFPVQIGRRMGRHKRSKFEVKGKQAQYKKSDNNDKDHPSKPESHIKKGKNPDMTKRWRVRSSLNEPGIVVILLVGRHRGKRVISLGRQRCSGLLLVTGPYQYNGCPLRRVHPNYVMATKTKVDLKKFSVPKRIHKKEYFARTPKPKTKNVSEIFDMNSSNSNQIYKPSEERQSDQTLIDQAVCEAIHNHQDSKLLIRYLKSLFCLGKHDRPHEMYF